MGRRRFPNTVKSLVHFDFAYFGEPGDGCRDEIGLETWARQGNVKFVGTELPNDEVVAGTPLFGYRCLQGAGTSDYLECSNNTGIWNINSDGNYEVSFFMRPTDSTAGNLFTINDWNGIALQLSKDTTNKLTLASTSLGLNATGTAVLTTNTFQFITIRIAGSTAAVFVDGVQDISAAVTAGVTFLAANAQLGGFKGQVDEFMFRHTASVGMPLIPGQPYQGMLKPADLGGTGDGSFGDVTINTANNQINTYAMISSVASNRILTIGSQNAGIYGSFEVGQEVMVHLSLKRGVAENNLGKYELRRIESVGPGIVMLDSMISSPELSLNAATLDAYYVQLISVPNYNNLTVGGTGTIISADWSESYGGGMVALRCKDTLTLDGKITTVHTGPKRTDSLNLTHASILDNFVLTGNVFIVADRIEAGPDARIGSTQDGSLQGGSGALSQHQYYGGAYWNGVSGSVGNGGNGGDVILGDSLGYGGNAGFGGGGGGGSNSDKTPEMDGLSSANVILVAKQINISKSAISTGGGGGGGSVYAIGYGPTYGGGGAYKGLGKVFTTPSQETFHAGNGADANSNGVGHEGLGNGVIFCWPGGSPGGAGYGGGGGAACTMNNSQGTSITSSAGGGGGSGTGFAYIAADTLLAA